MHKLRAALFGSVMIAVGSTAVARAQTVPAPETEAQNDSAGEGVIVVTANRREQNAQRIGIAVTAVGGDIVGDQVLVRAEQLDRLIPGFTAAPNSGSSVSAFSIRGVGQSDFAPHQEQPNATYQDGVYVASADAIGMPVFDVQRVEVLRGPQSTLFGRNATGGVVQFITNKPNQAASGLVEGTYGNRDLNRVQAVLNGPLSSSVSGRVALYFQNKDGFINNLAGEDLLAERTIAGRAQLAFDLAADTDLNLRIDGFDQSGTSFGGKHRVTDFDANGVAQFVPAPATDVFGFRDPNPDPRTVSVTTPGDIDKEVWNAAATFSHGFGDTEFVSISAYSSVKSNYLEDTDAGPDDNVLFGTSADARFFSQELRLANTQGSFRWTAGLYYFNIDGDYTNFFDLPSSSARYDSDYSLKTESFAAFGQIEQDLTERLKLIVGGRWTEDRQRYIYDGNCTETAAGACSASFFLGLGLTDDDGNPVVGDIGEVTVRRSSGDWTGKLALEFQATDDVLLYASASKGLKGGGFTAPTDGLLSAAQLDYAPEELYAYETGFKSTLADGVVRLNASLYYYDYKNFQTFEFSGITSNVLNRPATAFGGEAELIIRPGSGFVANLGAAYNDFQVDDIVTPTAPGGERQRPVNAPKFTANWTLTKDFELGGGLTLSALYSGRYTSSRYYNVVNLPVVRGAPFTLHDASLTLRSGSGLYGRLFVNNLTDEKYVNFSFDLTGFFRNSLDHIGEGRVVGLTIGYDF